MSGDAIQSFLDTHEQSASSDIPVHRAADCCCGNASCAHLRRNQRVLADLEKDVGTAARLGKRAWPLHQIVMHPATSGASVVATMATTMGLYQPAKLLSPRTAQPNCGTSSLIFSLQALLMRHEAYIADSERERKAMTAHIETLEIEKQTLEQKNATAIEENRDLLDQLERLNGAVAESDTQVTNLQATLRSTQQELSRLSNLAARTEHLEQQLAEFEREQASWTSTLEEKETSEKSAIRRWQQAERILAGLQEQMETIEREAREEKDRHVEVLGRMERRHAVERELDSAAGRLKGAAALKTANESGGPTVVSHFVKDILQDNANLQMGIIELRDMLQNSNEEVENLRTQLSLHQPVAEEVLDDAALDHTAISRLQRPHLSEEMRAATTSELHVHHHYHAPPSAVNTRRSRSKKKRYGALAPGQYTPPSSISTPRYSCSQGPPSSTAAILSQTAASLPESVGGKRWSLQSNQTYQSMRDYSRASSPGSTNRAPSVFDRVFSDAGQDSSRPTTPETEDPGSPMWGPTQSKRSSSSSYHRTRPSSSTHRNRPSLDSILDMSTGDIRHMEQQTSESVIPEEDEHDWENTNSEVSPERDITPLSEELDLAFGKNSHTLRRATSHESIMSFSGMDIHTLKSRPSQLLAPYAGRSFTSHAVLTEATAHATRPAAISRSTASGHRMLSEMAPSTRTPSGASLTSTKPGIGSKVGGWVFGRWGASPAPSTASDAIVTPKAHRAVSIASESTGQSAEDTQVTPKKPTKQRPPGINQPGPILGFAAETKLQHPPIMKSFDPAAMKSILDDEI